MIQISQLFSVVDAYMLATRRRETTVSTSVFNDGKKLSALRKGTADIGIRRFNTALIWFSEHWPENAAWPEGVERPTSSEDAA